MQGRLFGKDNRLCLGCGYSSLGPGMGQRGVVLEGIIKMLLDTGVGAQVSYRWKRQATGA